MAKKLLIALLVIIMSVAVFSACKPGDTGYTDPQSDEEGLPTNPEIVIWYTKTTEQFRVMREENIEGLMEAFPQDYPTLTVDYQGFDLGVLNPSLLASAIQAGNQPDMVLGNMAMTGYFQQIVGSFNPYIEQDSDYDINNLPPVWNLVGAIRGQHYSIPVSVQMVSLAVNVDMLEDNGLTTDIPDCETILTMQEPLTKFNDKGKVIQTGFADIWYGAVMYLKLYDKIGYNNEAGNIGYINTEAMEKTIQWYRDLAAPWGGVRNLSSEMNVVKSTNARIDAWKGGYLAMTLVEYTPQWQGADFNMTLVPMPFFKAAGENNLLAFQEDAYTLIRDCANPYGAWFYLKWYMSMGALTVCENNNYANDPERYYPAYYLNEYVRTRVYDLYFDELSEDMKTLLEQRDNYIETRNLVFGSIGWTVDGLWTVFYTKCNSLVDSATSIKEALKDYQREADEYSEEWFESMREKGWDIGPDDPWGTPPSSAN